MYRVSEIKVFCTKLGNHELLTSETQLIGGQVYSKLAPQRKATAPFHVQPQGASGYEYDNM